MLTSVVFYFLAVLLIVSAMGVVTSSNVFHCALALASGLAVVAALFAMLGADFLAASQLLVYVGGVMIVMLFVIMFSQRPLDALQRQTQPQWLWGLLASLVVTGALLLHLGDVLALPTVSPPMNPTSAPLGRLLLGEMLVPFEVVSLVLLAALVGAVFFGQDRLRGPRA